MPVRHRRAARRWVAPRRGHHDEHGNVATTGVKGVGEGGSAHHGHDGVAQDDIDGCDGGIEEGEGIVAVCCYENLVAPFEEHMVECLAESGVVLDDEDGLAVAVQQGLVAGLGF